MRFTYFILSLTVLLNTSCFTKRSNDYTPEKYLSSSEQIKVKEQIIQYLAKAPESVTTDSMRLDTVHTEYYAKQIKNHQLIAYYISDKQEHFFLIARIAPSMEEKWVATGGMVRFGTNQEVLEYEEVFRTWKLPKDLMTERSKYLFDLMVKGENLTPYYAKTAGFNYIEFPDDNVFFDKQSRTWKSKKFESVEEMVNENRDLDSLSKK